MLDAQTMADIGALRDDLIAAHGDLPQLMPYLHLPVQSGSDRILKAMNRKHSAEQYLRLIERIRGDAAVSGGGHETLASRVIARGSTARRVARP